MFSINRRAAICGKISWRIISRLPITIRATHKYCIRHGTNIKIGISVKSELAVVRAKCLLKAKKTLIRPYGVDGSKGRGRAPCSATIRFLASWVRCWATSHRCLVRAASCSSMRRSNLARRAASAESSSIWRKILSSNLTGTSSGNRS